MLILGIDFFDGAIFFSRVYLDSNFVADVLPRDGASRANLAFDV